MNTNYPKCQSACPVVSIAFVFLVLLKLLVNQCNGASFQNMNFEQGPVYNNPLDYSAIYPDVLPYWTVRFGTNVQSGASCNNFTLDYPVVALMSSGGFLGSGYVIAGSRSAYLQSSASIGDPSSAVNVSISQVGDVPVWAKTLLISARNQWYDSFPVAPGPLNVSVAGLVLPLYIVSSSGADITYGVNVAAWAGQTAELSIGVLASPAWGGANWEGWAVIDSLTFSATAVPEPGTLALGALGGALLLVARRRIFNF